MTYLLKHRDQALLRFNLHSDPIAGLSAQILECNSNTQHLFPLDLDPTDTGLLKWLKRRIIPRNRAFVQSFLAKLGLNVNDTKGIIDICRGLSLNDCYWVAEESFNGTFARYNLYENRFSRILSLIAYTGYGEYIRSDFASTPELTTGGMLAKCWRRTGGKIVLYKAGSTGAANAGNEPYSEFYAWQIAQTMGLNAVEYNLRQWKGQLCSTCELFTSLNRAYIPAGRLVPEGGWPVVMQYYKQLGERYYDSLIDMLIFDAVICNEDRHFGNFGLLIDNDSNSIVDTAPIFDNGLSLFNYAMDDDLQDMKNYIGTRLMATSQDFVVFAQQVITAAQKKKLRRLINFRFRRHPRYNLPAHRLSIIENFIQQRVHELLLLQTE
ncbi:MAG: hypothetical protein SD837_07330 [Candidatus Electrothrix scaldis]|nr:MAG: hypothetical protein SD837_07330 [Candidatus Electrothrix sp. GW3-3]